MIGTCPGENYSFSAYFPSWVALRKIKLSSVFVNNLGIALHSFYDNCQLTILNIEECQSSKYTAANLLKLINKSSHLRSLILNKVNCLSASSFLEINKTIYQNLTHFALTTQSQTDFTLFNQSVVDYMTLYCQKLEHFQYERLSDQVKIDEQNVLFSDLISRNPNLVHIDINCFKCFEFNRTNPKTEELIKTIATYCHNLVYLRHECEPTENMKNILLLIKNCPHLQKLFIITENLIEFYYKSIEKKLSFKRLDFYDHNNNKSKNSELTQDLILFFSSVCNLKSIDFDHTSNFPTEVFHLIITNNCDNLVVFKMGCSNRTNSGSFFIAILKHCKQLKYLSYGFGCEVNNCNSFETFTQDCVKSESLVHLVLDQCVGEHTGCIFPFCPNLEIITFSYTHITHKNIIDDLRLQYSHIEFITNEIDYDM
jgi:hypothetical protein